MYTNICATNKSGTVGSNLYFAKGPKSKEYDFRQLNQAQKFIHDFKPDCLIHNSAVVGGLGDHLKNQGSHLIDNIDINNNILKSAKNAGVRRVLSFMSSCVFGDAKSDWSETDVHNYPLSPIHINYGTSKRVLDLHSRLYWDSNFSYNCVIPVNIFGFFDSFSLTSGHVVSSLIHKCFLAKEKNEDFVIWGSGQQERNYLFSTDLMLLTSWCLDHYLEKEPLILSDGIPVRTSDLAYLIADKFKFKGKVVFDKSKPEGQKSRLLSGAKLKSRYPDFVFTKLEYGISSTIDWFLSNYPNVRL